MSVKRKRVKPLFIAPEIKDTNNIKKDILIANKVIRILSAPNKAAAIEKFVLGNVANSIAGLMPKIAAAEAFNDEMEKIAHTFNQAWSKVGIKDKIMLNLFNKKDRIKSLLDSGRQISAMRSIDGTLGRPLIRSIPEKPAAYVPELIQKDTYRKPGAF